MLFRKKPVGDWHCACMVLDHIEGAAMTVKR